MTGLSNVPSDQKKYIDQALYAYLPKKKTLRTLIAEETVDSAQSTNIYGRLTQSYSEAKGYYALDDPVPLADGARPSTDGMGTEDGTAYQKTWSHAYNLERKLLKSGLPFMKSVAARAAVELVNTIENKTNVDLNTAFASNAAQSYTATGGTWATTGDPVADINAAKTAFKKRAGGMDANFMAVNPSNVTDIKNDLRFQNVLYSPESKVLEDGTIVKNPSGLQLVEETAITTGTFFMGAKGMFGKMLISEPYAVTETPQGVAGNLYEAVFTYVTQFQQPYYLLYGTGI